MERTYYEGQPVIYVDTHGVRHDALITMWWSFRMDGDRAVHALPDAEWLKTKGEPGCNLLYVTADPSKDDPYGRQIERATSVIHKSRQSAPGNYWCWLDE